MIIRPLLASLSASPFLLSLLFFPSQIFAKNEPKVTSNSFTAPLENVFYFEDSDVIVGHDRAAGTVYRSSDAGATWKPVDDLGEAGHAWDLWPHPWDNQRAYILGTGKHHWMTTDQGESWRKFDSMSPAVLGRMMPLSFHGRDAKKVLWNGESCGTGQLFCEAVTYYTDNDFHTTTTLTKGTRGGCSWGVSTPQFGEKDPDKVDDLIFCIKEGLYSSSQKDFRLVYSNDYFEKEEIEPALDDDRPVTGVISMAAVKRYLVAAAKGEGSNELGLYVTKNGTGWYRAEFGQHKVEEDAYTILESTNYSMQVDVLEGKPLNPMGYLFTSNSDGRYFTRNIDYTNRSPFGRVDFEKVTNIQGIVLVNTVKNWESVKESMFAKKEIISQISFDDGRTFHDLKVGDKKLHIHSVTDAAQMGKMFSSPAPGILMAIGNTGSSLTAYEDGDLYVSDDAGLTWTKGLDGAHLYEFGNQGAILVAIDDEDSTKYLRYSVNHGKDWEKLDLGMTVRAKFLTTVPDSTTLKFLLMGTVRKNDELSYEIFKIDFSGLHERSCGNSDFDDKWPARVDEDGKPSCIMGHKQFFRRRKADKECFIDGEFKDPVPQFEPCVCTALDFECDYGFHRSIDGNKCTPASPLTVPDGVCKDSKGTFKGSSGWRLIPGNVCKRDGGVELDKEIDRPCSDTTKEPASGKVSNDKKLFEATRFNEWYYLERGNQDEGTDETVLMRTSGRDIFITKDHGKTWKQVLDGKTSINRILPNPKFHNNIYFLTGGEKVYYTIDRGDSFEEMKVPTAPTKDVDILPLRFHPAHRDWLLWFGADETSDRTNVYYSKNRGASWELLTRGSKKCDYINREDTDTLIFCEQYENEKPGKNLQLVSSDNFFADRIVHFPDILDFATMSEFIIVAAKTEDKKSLKVDASVHGGQFAAAHFPKNFQVEHQQAYTVLDSSTHAVFLHVTVNPSPEQEYGTIIKSNSNGTNYVKVLDYVNRDRAGYVDFEKMQGLDGVAMVNVVANPDAVDGGDMKVIKSKISHNDGSDWALIPPPKDIAGGGTYKCVRSNNVATEDCSLHIHSYTERMDKSATFSSPTAVGLMMAVGNVGSELLSKDSAATDTFITRDAGITWQSVMKGSYMWEYGDQGSIIAIVEEQKPTKRLFYTLDEGRNWIEYQFSEIEMEIISITTVPSDTSRQFLLWGREVGPGSHTGTIATVNVDFSGLEERNRECKLDSAHPEKSQDFMLWEPKHPFQGSGNCLFGHVSQYYRKKLDADCYIGRRLGDVVQGSTKNCACTRQDFECDFNYQRQGDGICALVPGYDPPDHMQVCDDKKVDTWWEPTGYRRIPLSTCEGGQELDKIDPRPCPGKQAEFEKKHGYKIGAIGIFFLTIFSVSVAGGIGYWVWDQYQKRGFGGLGFGAIRLGDGLGSTSLARGTSGNLADSPFIAVPVAIVAGVVAVGRALPLLVTSLFRSAKGYVPVNGSARGGYGVGGGGGSGPYRSRDAFASRRQDYSGGEPFVEDDELLGEEDDADEEV